MLYQDIKQLVKNFVSGVVEIELDRRMDEVFLPKGQKKAHAKFSFDKALASIRTRAARKAAVTRKKNKDKMRTEEKQNTESTEDAVEPASPTTPPAAGDGDVTFVMGLNGKTEASSVDFMLFSRARRRDAIREAKKRGLKFTL